MINSKVSSETAGIKAKATADIKGKAKARREPVYPEFDTLEEALSAALRCTKCQATTMGTKGCKACMGSWFEAIMQAILMN